MVYIQINNIVHMQCSLLNKHHSSHEKKGNVMTTHVLPMSTDAQSDLLEVVRECDDHGSHDARGGSSQTLIPQARAQFTLKLPPLVMEASITIMLRYLVVHDQTSGHHLPHGL